MTHFPAPYSEPESHIPAREGSRTLFENRTGRTLESPSWRPENRDAARRVPPRDHVATSAAVAAATAVSPAVTTRAKRGRVGDDGGQHLPDGGQTADRASVAIIWSQLFHAHLETPHSMRAGAAWAATTALACPGTDRYA
jgi:hypothetical protein